MLKIRDNFMNLIHQTIITISQKDKLNNFKTAIRAIKDGFQGKSGK